MVNTELAKSPLGGIGLGDATKVFLKEVPFTPGFDLRVQPGTPAFTAVIDALGLKLEPTVGRVMRINADCIVSEDEFPAQGGVIALCLGPDWWYLTGTADIQKLLSSALETHHLSLVDVSSQRTKIEIYGPSAKDVLLHYWEQDLREDNFPIDSCSQGVFAKTPVIMWHCCKDCYILFPRASFAKHIWTALTDAAVEYL